MANWGVSVGGFSMGSGGTSDSSPSSGGTGTLLGSNQLQSSVDRLDQDIQKLTAAVSNKLGGFAGGGGSSNGGGPIVSTTGGGWLSSPQGSGNLPIVSQQSPGKANGGGPAVRPFQSQTQNANGGGTGGGGYGGGPVSGAMRGLGMPAGAAGAGMIADALVGYGQSQLPTQVAMSSFAQTATLAMNGGNPSANTNAARFAAFGGRNGNLNGVALNAQDAIAGQQGINFIAGQGAVTPSSANSYGRGALSATAAFGLSNQGLGAGASAQLAQSLYAPSTSQKFLQYGFPVTPRMMGGGLRNPAQVSQGLIQGFYGKNSVSPSELAFSLRQGGNAQTTLQSMFGNQAGDYSNLLQAENQVAFKSGMNPTQINSLFNSAARGSPSSMKSAQQQLQGFGVNTSDIQSIKNLNSVKTGRSSDVADSFNAGLQTATGLLTSFNAILTKIVDIPGVNQLVGGAGGLGGGFGGLTNGASLGVGAAGGSMLLKRLIAGRAAGAAGGGAATSVGTASGDSALIAGESAGAGGIAAGGLGLSMAGGLAAGGLVYGLSKVHNSNGSSLLSQAPGGSRDPLNSWSGFGDASTAVGRRIGSSLLGGARSIWDGLFGGGNNQPNIGGGAASVGSKSASTKTKNSPSVGGVSGAAQHAIGSAEQEVGVPYVWGGDSPKVGFDCSGLVEWAYGTAGVHLPRTSEQQWAFLSKGHSIALDKTQGGDIVFQAGSDGTEQAPGHEAMMINSRQIIEAPYTGADVRIRAYNPKEWQHAGRPTGGMGGSSSSGASVIPGLNNNNSGSADTGLGLDPGSYGSSEEIDNIMGALLGGAGGVDTGFSAKSNGSSGSNSTAASAGNAKPGLMTVARYIQAHGGSIAAAAGVAGVVSGESGGNPESRQQGGGGGEGILQWTPGTSAKPIYPIITGNAQKDMGNQLVDMLHYIAGRGGMGALNSAGKNGPMSAASRFSTMEGPAVPGSDIRGGDVMNIYRALGGKGFATGTLNAGRGWSWTGERGPELKFMQGGEGVLPASMSAHVAKQAAKGVTEPDSLVSTAASSSTGGTVTIPLTFQPGSMVFKGSMGSSGEVAQNANEFVNQVVKRLQTEQVFADIAAGVHSGN